MTLTHHGGMDIEELDKSQVAAGSLRSADRPEGVRRRQRADRDLTRPSEIISPLVQQLPKLWELFHNFGMTTLELNPIRMRPDAQGPPDPGGLRLQVRLRPRRPALAAPEPAGRTCSPSTTPISSRRSTSSAPTRARATSTSSTPAARSWRPTFGGGANSLVTEMLGDDAIISSDFGGNPPYEKMKEVARICFKHWLKQTNVLFIIGGKSNNTDIFETLRAMADALREHFSKHGPTPLYVVIGRGGPNLVRGMGAMRDTWRRWACRTASSASTPT